MYIVAHAQKFRDVPWLCCLLGAKPSPRGGRNGARPVSFVVRCLKQLSLGRDAGCVKLPSPCLSSAFSYLIEGGAATSDYLDYLKSEGRADYPQSYVNQAFSVDSPYGIWNNSWRENDRTLESHRTRAIQNDAKRSADEASGRKPPQ